MKTIALLLLSLLAGPLATLARTGPDTEPGGTPDPARYQLTITAPTDGSRVPSGAPLTIRAVAVDALDAVYSLDFLVDGQVVGNSTIDTLVALEPGTPVQHEFVWQKPEPGPHQLQVSVPGAGSEGLSSPVRIEVGGTVEAPRVTLLKPADGSEFKAGVPVTLEAESMDPDGILDVVEFLVDGAVVGESRISFCPPCLDPPLCPMGPCILPPIGAVLQHTFTWEKPSPGRHELKARAARANGDWVVSTVIQVTIVGDGPAAWLAFLSPTEGSVWATPGIVPLHVTAVDPDGEIRRVEFFAGDQRIGVSEILTRDAEVPGRPRSHVLNWTNPPAGPATLRARATARSGAPVESAPRLIQVKGAWNPPVVWIEAVDSERTEPNLTQDCGDCAPDTLRFRIHRIGAGGTDLQVFYQAGGDAKAGVDYQALPGSVPIPAATESVDVAVHPVADKEDEGDEIVTLELVPSPTMGPLEPYKIDPARSIAKGILRDSGSNIPQVTVRVARPYALEGDWLNRAELILERTGNLETELQVQFTVTGAAVRGADYDLVRNPCDLCLAPVEEIRGDTVYMGARESQVTVGVVAQFDGLLAIAEPVLENVMFQIHTPPIPAVVGAKPPYWASNPDQAEVYVVDRRHPDKAELVIIAPKAGSVLPLGVSHEIRALGVDPKGSIRRMELTANGSLIGVSEITTEEVDVPGRLREHRFRWRVDHASQAGSYQLQAQAVLASGESVRSLEVPVKVSGSDSGPAVITLSPGKSPAYETGDLKSRLGSVVLRRTGGPDSLPPITVFVAVRGTATPGLDYQWNNPAAMGPEGIADSLPPIGSVFLPVPLGAGSRETILSLTARPDDELEGTETVTVEVIPPPILVSPDTGTPSSPEPLAYIVGEPRSEEILIIDGNLTAPSVVIQQPKSGFTVAAGLPIPIIATAIHPELGIEGIQFLADGKVIGFISYCCDVCDCGPAPVGRAFTARWDWKGASVGPHVLTARIFLGPNVSVDSPPVTITVVEGSSVPRISWVAPAEGSSFLLGRPIELEVEAVDPTGLLWVVEFLANGRKIGESQFSCPECGILPGKPLPHRFTWKNAPEGRHTLTARAFRADGSAVTSSERRIVVTADPAPPIRVVRDLPESYEAGKAFRVQLAVTPAAGTAAYVVEEKPPYSLPAPGTPGVDSPFWSVVNISDGGQLDPLTGKVKFGPYFDPNPRTLSYEVVPNQAVEIARFEGVGVADGQAAPITGDQELAGSRRHPADLDPADDTLTATELTGYASSWRRELSWPLGPNPIPVDYVTRAAALWKGGERYQFDPRFKPPFCWMNGQAPGSGNTDSTDPQGLAGLALRHEETLADGSRRVILRIRPAAGIRAFAVEERLAHSATPESISSGGEFQVQSRTLRWGPFHGELPVEVSYRVPPGSGGAHAEGQASFDGQSVPIHPTPARPPGGVPQLVAVDRLQDGSLQVGMECGSEASAADFDLEASTDLKHWIPLGAFAPAGTGGMAHDRLPGTSEARFYRAIRRE